MNIPNSITSIGDGALRDCSKLTNITLPNGVTTIGDFALDNQDETKKILGKFYYVLKDWAYGKGSDEVITEASDPKSIGNSTTFLFDTDDYDEIRSMIYQESLDVSKRAEKENKIGYTS